MREQGRQQEASAIAEVVPQPGSVLWRYAGDARLLATGAYAILLQVGHPSVGAGVSEHSDFRADPWGRLLRTLDYSYTLSYGGPELAAAMGAQIREMHKPIKGVRPDGERYHALEPDVYAWVHATLAHSIVRGHALLGREMRSDQVERFYLEWHRMGRLIGVREQDLPPDWPAFREYFERMCGEVLQRTPAVDEVLTTLEDPIRPSVPLLTDAAWRVARIPATRQIGLVTAGLLSPQLRERFGIPWNPARDRRFRLLAAASRAATPVLPGRLRNFGPTYLRIRREAISGTASSTEVL